MEKVLEPPDQCGSTTQIFKDLSTKLGLADFFPWDNDESMIDAIIDHPRPAMPPFRRYALMAAFAH